MNWYYSNGDKVVGPLAEATMREMRDCGVINSNTLVLCEGTQVWVPFDTAFGSGDLIAKAEENSSKGKAEALGQEDRSMPQKPPLPSNPTVRQPLLAERFFVALDSGESAGPFSRAELEEKLAAGTLQGQTLIWKEGTVEWVPIASVIGGGGRGVARDLADSVASLMGTERICGFSAKRFFGGIFQKHTSEEMQDFYCSGSSRTTPPLKDLDVIWPSPWIFSRVLLLSVLLYFGFGWATATFNNPKLVPGLMFAGNFAVPFSFLVLFAELNIRRNVSWLFIMKALIGGGLISLIFALILFEISKVSAPYWAGPIEEIAKLLAVVVIARGRFLDGRILTGVLLGAAIGTGFAIFESAGYTFEHLGLVIALAANGISDSTVDPDKVMQIRALLSPFCHVIWTAITAGALWSIMGGRSFSMSMLCEKGFLRIALVPVVLHMFWNSSILASDGAMLLKILICAIIGWTVVLLLVNQGISQVHREKNGMSPSNGEIAGKPAGFAVTIGAVILIVCFSAYHDKKGHESKPAVAVTPATPDTASSQSKQRVNREVYDLYMQGYLDPKQGDTAAIVAEGCPDAERRSIYAIIVLGAVDRRSGNPVRFEIE